MQMGAGCVPGAARDTLSRIGCVGLPTASDIPIVALIVCAFTNTALGMFVCNAYYHGVYIEAP